MDARKHRLGAREALAALDGIDHLYATRGRTVIHLDLRAGRPPRAELLALLLGPSGNLRAPAVRSGRTLLVGFDEATYSRVVAAGP